MIEFEVTLRDGRDEFTKTFMMTHEQAAATGDRHLMERVVEQTVDSVVQEWRVPGWKTGEDE